MVYDNTIITVEKCEASRRGILHRVTTRDHGYIKITFFSVTNQSRCC